MDLAAPLNPGWFLVLLISDVDMDFAPAIGGGGDMFGLAAVGRAFGDEVMNGVGHEIKGVIDPIDFGREVSFQWR